ncbi:MAG: hypothetical protein IAE92_02530 [Burkholderiaceae bacterium]|nr:hypothetical protein [Burkholderiaceae bacterium]
MTGDGTGEDAQAVIIQAHVAINRLLNHTFDLLGEGDVLGTDARLVGLMAGRALVSRPLVHAGMLNLRRQALGFLGLMAPAVDVPGDGPSDDGAGNGGSCVGVEHQNGHPSMRPNSSKAMKMAATMMGSAFAMITPPAAARI